MDIENITADSLLDAFGLLKQLRQHIKFEEFIIIYKLAQQANQYTLVGAYEDGILIGLMGYRILHDYVHGKHLYIDDLVVDGAHRGRGISKALLAYAENIAAKLDCNGLRLSTGIAHTTGIKFYEAIGWELKACTFKKGFQAI
ncbi:GNAT family N-acetyltransferase [Mucilaginibacter pedocola]|nr:GNAT family N-acetyltransferase [Mucilaginibacter pedocola]